MKKQIENSDKRLDDIIKQHNEQYDGTVPIEDTRLIHLKTTQEMLNVKYDKVKKQFVLKTEIDLSIEYSNPFDIYGFGIKAYF